MVLMMKFKTRIRHHFAGQHTFRGRPLLDRYSTVTRPLLDRYATITRPLHAFFMSYRYLPGTWARLCHIASRYLPVALRYKTSIFAYIPRDMYAEGKFSMTGRAWRAARRPGSPGARSRRGRRATSSPTDVCPGRQSVSTSAQKERGGRCPPTRPAAAEILTEQGEGGGVATRNAASMRGA